MLFNIEDISETNPRSEPQNEKDFHSGCKARQAGHQGAWLFYGYKNNNWNNFLQITIKKTHNSTIHSPWSIWSQSSSLITINDVFELGCFNLFAPLVGESAESTVNTLVTKNEDKIKNKYGAVDENLMLKFDTNQQVLSNQWISILPEQLIATTVYLQQSMNSEL